MLAALLLSAASLLSIAAAQESGGRLVLARPDPPSILDPHKTGESAADQIHVQLGGSLVTTEPGTLNIIPWLAESFEQSEDGLTYTFQVRQDVSFHNGDPLTAHDFKWTYERALDPATQASAARDMLSNVESIEVNGEHELVIRLSAPSAVFLRNLSSAGYLQPLSQRAVEEQGDAYGRNPVGVGPYRFKEWIAGYSITLERNPDFAWPASFYDNAGAAYPDEFEVRYIPEQGTIIAALETGEVDVVTVPATDLFIFEDNPAFEINSILRNGIGMMFMFNLNDPLFEDIRVRQAFAHAVDREFFVENALEGRGIVATSVLPPSLPGFDPATEGTAIPYDPEAAAALLDEAGWTVSADGIRERDGERLSVRIVAYTGDAIVRDSEIFQNQLRRIGADVTIEVYERALQTSMLVDGDFHFAPIGWTYTDPDVLYLLYHSSQWPAGLNYGAVNNAELDAALESGRQIFVDEERMLAYHEAQRIYNENVLGIPLYVPEAFTVSNSRVGGLIFDLLGNMRFHDVWIGQ